MIWNQILSVIWLKSIHVLWYNLFHIEKKFFRLNQSNFWLIVSSQFYIHFRLKYHISSFNLLYFTPVKILSCDFFVHFSIPCFLSLFFVSDLFNLKINKYRYLFTLWSFIFFFHNKNHFLCLSVFIFDIHFLPFYLSLLFFYFILFSVMMLLLSNEKLKMLL